MPHTSGVVEEARCSRAGGGVYWGLEVLINNYWLQSISFDYLDVSLGVINMWNG